MHIQLLNSREYFGFTLIENGLEPAFPQGVKDQPVLVSQRLLFLLIGESATRHFLRVGGSPFTDAAPANKDLGLQQLLTFACLALHVVDSVFVLNVGIKTKDHLNLGD